MEVKDIKISNLIPKSDIRNSYTFKVIDENGNVIDTQTYHNITMSKRYFSNNVSDLNLVLGTMLKDDYSKYQKDGKWLKGWATSFDDKGNEVKSSNDTFDVEENFPGTDRKKYVFKGKVTENDESLIGTAVQRIQLNWVVSSINNNSVTLTGTGSWGYHDTLASYNIIRKGGDGKNITSGSRGNNISGIPESSDDWSNSGLVGDDEAIQEEPTYWRQDFVFNHKTYEWELTGEWYQVTYQSEVYGVSICDGGLFSGNTMLSHFKADTMKRPTDKINITIEVTFEAVSIPFGTPFIPEGNISYANGINSSYSGTARYKPNALYLSSYPIRACGGSVGGGIVPIPSGGIRIPLSEVGTDKPNDWVDDEQGTWFGFPQYRYFCSGDIYRTVEEQVKEGDNIITKTSYDMNSKEQKLFNWDNLKDKTVTRLNSANFGPVRSLVLEGLGADTFNGLVPGDIKGIRIGTGDGQRKRFYHPFTTETGTCTGGYSKYTNITNARVISPQYDKSKNPLTNFIGIYNNNGELLCPADKQNTLYNNYDKKKKYCYFGLHPFNLQYYPYGTGLLGSYEWLVYSCSETIKTAWIGMYSAPYISSTMFLRTANSIEGLFDGRARSVTVGYGTDQHDQQVLNFESDGYIAVKGSEGWSSGLRYVGGLWYNTYDYSGIRISTEDNITGYIEFDEAPERGAFIYIDATINVPFIHYFNGFTTSVCYQFGQESDNGTKVD